MCVVGPLLIERLTNLGENAYHTLTSIVCYKPAIIEVD
jgi:hypothetical protein